MTKISRYLPDTKIIQYIQSQLFDAFSLLKDEHEVQAFLQILLTRTEIKMLAKRLGIAKMYLNKANYQTIRSALKVSDTTIARISSKLVDSPAIVHMVDKLNQIDQAEKQRREHPPSPMDKYTRGTRVIEHLVDSAVTTTAKKLTQNLRHRRIKSHLITTSSSKPWNLHTI